MNSYKEIQSGSKPFKRAYVALMLWFVGRAIEAAARVDGVVKAEFDGLAPGFTFSLGVMPQGPTMIVGKDAQGLVKYRGWNTEGQKIDLKMKVKNLEGAISRSALSGLYKIGRRTCSEEAWRISDADRERGFRSS